MENLSIDQARGVKRTFLENVSPAVQKALGGVGICVVSETLPAFGIKVNLVEDIDDALVLDQFPLNLRGNVSIDFTGPVEAL